MVKTGTAGQGRRHYPLVAVAGRLVQLGWDDARIHRLITPQVNECFGVGDVTAHFQATIDHARAKQAAQIANLRSVRWSA
jgi:hypothetical protein